MTKLDFQYHDGGRVAAGYPHARARDCVVRAVAIVTGAPYQDVYDEAERIKRAQGKQAPDKGFPTSGIRRLLLTFAADIEGPIFPSTTVGGRYFKPARLVAENLPPVARCLVLIRGHAAAVIEGTVYDTWNPARTGRREIQYYYRVTPRSEWQKVEE